MLNHLAYKAWCPSCVTRRRRSAVYRSAKNGEEYAPHPRQLGSQVGQGPAPPPPQFGPRSTTGLSNGMAAERGRDYLKYIPCQFEHESEMLPRTESSV